MVITAIEMSHTTACSGVQQNTTTGVDFFVFIKMF